MQLLAGLPGGAGVGEQSALTSLCHPQALHLTQRLASVFCTMTTTRVTHFYGLPLLLALLLPGCSETSSPDLAAAMPLESSASAAKTTGEPGPLAPAVEACIQALLDVEIHLLQWVTTVQQQCLSLGAEDQALAAATATLRTNNEITFLKPSQALQELEADRVPYQSQTGSSHEERLALAGVYQAQRSFAQAQQSAVVRCQWHMVITGIKHKSGDPEVDYANRRAACKNLDGDQTYEARSKAREIIEAINADRVN